MKETVGVVCELSGARLNNIVNRVLFLILKGRLNSIGEKPGTRPSQAALLCCSREPDSGADVTPRQTPARRERERAPEDSLLQWQLSDANGIPTVLWYRRGHDDYRKQTENVKRI